MPATAIPDITVTTNQFARLVRARPRWIQELTKAGVIKRAVDEEGRELRSRYALETVGEFCDYLRTRGKVTGASQATYESSRIAKMAADAETAQLRLRVLKGELLEAREAEVVWTLMLTACKARLIAIPSRSARQCVGRPFKEIYDLLMTEIELALRELAEFKRRLVRRQERAMVESGNGAALQND